jgi:hypothetical protein
VAIVTGVEARSHRIVVVIDDGDQGDFAALAAKVPHDVERGSHSELRCIVERSVLRPWKQDVCQMYASTRCRLRVIEETTRFDESYTLIPLKHLASCQIGGSR